MSPTAETLSNVAAVQSNENQHSAADGENDDGDWSVPIFEFLVFISARCQITGSNSSIAFN